MRLPKATRRFFPGRNVAECQQRGMESQFKGRSHFPPPLPFASAFVVDKMYGMDDELNHQTHQSTHSHPHPTNSYVPSSNTNRSPNVHGAPVAGSSPSPPYTTIRPSPTTVAE